MIIYSQSWTIYCKGCVKKYASKYPIHAELHTKEGMWIITEAENIVKISTIKSKSYMQLKYMIACPCSCNYSIVLEVAIIGFTEFCVSRSKSKSIFHKVHKSEAQPRMSVNNNDINYE